MTQHLGEQPMRAEDLLHWNRAVPFKPYRIRMNSGRTFDVMHPEMLMIGRTTAIVSTMFHGPGEPYDRIEMISMVLIESVEPIPSTALVA
jgi:hypothetical protein